MNETTSGVVLVEMATNTNYSLLTTTTTMTNNQTINSTSEFAYSFSPNIFEWCLLVFAFTIFVVGIIGNLLVIIVVVKNVHMRTITNIFIVNLAIGDFLVILICLPPSVITDIAGNWWFGETMCKIIPYVQYISVCVSVMTLTSISYERYYAIVYPLKFQATKFRAKVMLLVIWILAILINLPHPIVIRMQEENGMLFYCYPTWDKIYQNILDLLIFAILYILPMTLIFYTYRRVIKVLWKIDKSIAWDESPSSNNSTAAGQQPQQQKNNNNANNNSSTTNGRVEQQRPTAQVTTYSFSKKGGSGKSSATTASTTGGGGGDDLVDSNININNNKSCNKMVAAKTNNSLKPPSSYTAYTMANGSSAAMNKMKNQLIARRKAAKMLISVAVMFAICYLPIHILNIARFIGSNLLEETLGDYTTIIFQIAHCLVYVNSCVNPLIYNFMSDNFRKEFRKVIFCNMIKPGAHSSGLVANELKIRYLNGANHQGGGGHSHSRMTAVGATVSSYSNEPQFNSKLQPSSRNNSNSNSNYRLYE